MTFVTHYRPIGAAALLALLSACAVGPDYRPPAAASLKVPDRFVAERSANEVDLARWWTSFDDPVLTQLVERSLAANLDIEAAGARLRQARASLRQQQGGALPQLSASGSASRSIGNNGSTFVDPTTGQTISRGGDTTVYRAGFDASWEVDVFGGIRRSIEAARANAESSEANLHFAQVSVASEVGLNYLAARLAQTQLDIARKNLASQDETLEIVGWRVQAGLVSALDLEQSRQLRANTAATIPNLETSYNNAVNRIAVLLGEAPGAVNALMADARSVPLPPQAVGAAIPAEIVQRRPDIAAAERTLAAETARIGVAEAQLYPALRLSGSFSGSDTSFSDLPSAMIGNLVGAISAPIFQGGQIRAQIDGQRASADAALATYRQTVLTALEEVENALTALTAAERREREVVTAAEAAENAVILARSQYRAGLIDFQALLESERSLLVTQDSRATARSNRATATVQLYKALGGGWEAAPMPATALSKRP
ncbi:efflux transporter, outer membrane factor (OMF) lipoprotein, NodT family [Sphingomonas laterariae]|uniref:Efflux transporter, outer membrane factor (OMF) lipoprotein, NodT family n=1 Tax=Edaphosphingomonas laterariae TaxID=861865 RepID=A0A239BIS2_9SPHN|nr:efflux transporter outer membrane subunit [Sphingomonas laterariae]SNS08005.1 efflux transporter, outer membrane factor (OMF) lipoprotein, NodT family [Sphingomonas laterariae]